MPSDAIPTLDIARHLRDLRRERQLSQAEFARRSGLARPEFVYFETGRRLPSLRKLIQIAAAADVPLQRLLTGHDRPGTAIPDLAHELRSIGLIDLRVEGAVVPGAFRRTEEILARAVAGEEPPARVVEALPALLAWNAWNGPLLRAFARVSGKAVLARLAWLADIALAIERRGGFPGGCPAHRRLAAFVRATPKPPPREWDALGHSTASPPNSPIGKRWRVAYDAGLETFRDRAKAIVELARAEHRNLPGQR